MRRVRILFLILAMACVFTYPALAEEQRDLREGITGEISEETHWGLLPRFKLNPDTGLGTVKGGTLYPLLGRLESTGHVQARWEPGDGGPGRKVYSLTPAGRDHLEHQARRWARFTDLTRGLFEGSPTTGDPT